jgi:hypothetical protein
MEILDNEIDVYISAEEHEWEVFIGNKSGYYIPIWHKFQKQDSKVHIHLFALIFNVYWIAYRKMYKYAFAFLLFSLVFSFFARFFLTNIGYLPLQLISMLPYPILGLFGNWIYYQHAQNKIADIKHTYKTEASQQRAIIEVGQTNLLSPFIFFFLSIFLNIFVSLLLSFFY